MCHDCPLDPTRRDFLRDAGIAAAAAFATLGLSAATAQALPLAVVDGLPAAGAEVAYPVPGTDGATIDKARDVILVRASGALYAFRLQCPHQRTALRWNASAGQFVCPKHKSKYEPDGTFISGKATRGMDRFAIRREGEQVLVDTGRVFLEDKDRAGWEGAVVRL